MQICFHRSDSFVTSRSTYIIYRISLFFLLLVSHTSAFAMDGIGVYFKANFSGRIYKGLSFLIEEDFRPREDFKEAQWLLSTAELNYRIAQPIVVGAGYMSLIRYKDSSQQRNRYYFYATGSHKIGHFTLSIRERFQSTYKKQAEHPSNYLRSMFNISYKIPKTNFSPFSYVEVFNNTSKSLKADKIRLSAGTNYRLNAKNGLQLFYRYHIFNIKNDPVNYKHIVGICYSHKF